MVADTLHCPPFCHVTVEMGDLFVLERRSAMCVGFGFLFWKRFFSSINTEVVVVTALVQIFGSKVGKYF